MEIIVHKHFILFILLSLQLSATQYDSIVMAIEAKLFPKIALLEQHIKNDPSNILKISIVAKELDLDDASAFKDKIMSNYPNKLGNKQLHVRLDTFETIQKQSVDMIIVLSNNNEELENIASWANQNHIVSFAYDSGHMKYGFLASIYIGKSTKPYINKDVMLKYNFIFDSYLLQLSKIYH